MNQTRFADWTVYDFLKHEQPNFQLVQVEGTDSVAKVLEILTKNKISSAPILMNNQYIGIVDMLDLITFACSKFATVSLQASESFRQMEEYGKKEVRDIMDISGRNRMTSYQANGSLAKLIVLLSSPNLHRVYITNERKEIVGVISQSKLIQWIYENSKEFDGKWDKTIESLGFSHQKVVTVGCNEFMITAFRYMWEKNISAVGVVDSNNKLVGNVSASDLKSLSVKDSPESIGSLIGELLSPIKDFFSFRISLSDRIMKADLPKTELVAVKPKDNLRAAFEKIVNKKIHRVYVTDEQNHPVSIISLCNLLCLFQPKSESL